MNAKKYKEELEKALRYYLPYYTPLKQAVEDVLEIVDDAYSYGYMDGRYENEK